MAKSLKLLCSARNKKAVVCSALFRPEQDPERRSAKSLKDNAFRPEQHPEQLPSFVPLFRLSSLLERGEPERAGT